MVVGGVGRKCGVFLGLGLGWFCCWFCCFGGMGFFIGISG